MKKNQIFYIKQIKAIVNIKNKKLFLEKQQANYKINPKDVPRPIYFDEVYRDKSTLAEYLTEEGSIPPASTLNYIVTETNNSSCRFIRSTFNRIPTDQSVFNSMSIPLSLYIQPFAEQLEGEKEIPKIQGNKFLLNIKGESIYRCKRCEGYVNSKYVLSYSKSNKRTFQCNLCGCESELDSNKFEIKSEYYNSDTSNIPELFSPTVDFETPLKMKHTTPFIPHYIFLLDVSQTSQELGLPAYVKIN